MLDYYGLIAVGHIGGTGPAPSLAALHLRPQVWTRSCSQPTHCTWSPSLNSSYLHISTHWSQSVLAVSGAHLSVMLWQTKCTLLTFCLMQQGDMSGCMGQALSHQLRRHFQEPLQGPLYFCKSQHPSHPERCTACRYMSAFSSLLQSTKLSRQCFSSFVNKPRATPV